MLHPLLMMEKQAVLSPKNKDFPGPAFLLQHWPKAGAWTNYKIRARVFGASPGYLPTLQPCVTQRLLEPGMTFVFCSTQWISFPQFWAGSAKPHRNFQHPQLPIAESLGHPEIVVAGQEGLAKEVRVWEGEKGEMWQVVGRFDSSYTVSHCPWGVDRLGAAPARGQSNAMGGGI